MRVSCARSHPRAADAGSSDQSVRPGMRRQRQASLSHLELTTPDARGCWRASWTVASSSARHGRLRRNAVSPHGVRLSGAPGAPLWIGCSSANRTLAGKLLWDGIVAVPEVSGAGCLALSPVRRARATRPSGLFPTHPKSRISGGRIRTARITLGPAGPLYRVDGPSGITQAAEKSWKDH